MNRVQYIGVASLRVGHCALVLPLDHPSALVSNAPMWSLTSEVSRIVLGEKGPTFYTVYSEYRPCDDHEPMLAELVEPKKPLFSGQAVMEMCV